MQSSDFFQVSRQAHRGRGLAISGVEIRGVAVGGSVAGAILIAVALACMPFAAPSRASASGASTTTSSVAATRTISNVTLKGDRLPNAHFRSESHSAGNIVAPPTAKQSGGGSTGAAEKGERRIPAEPVRVGNAPKRRLPVGCESAFGALVHSGNTAARCVT